VPPSNGGDPSAARHFLHEDIHRILIVAKAFNMTDQFKPPEDDLNQQTELPLPWALVSVLKTKL